MVASAHPSAGLANRCTAPRCVGVDAEIPSGFPIATMLPSLFTTTRNPKSLLDPVSAVSWEAVDVAVDVVAHPVTGFVNTYAAPFPAS